MLTMGFSVRIRADLKGQDVRLLESYLRGLAESAAGERFERVNVVGVRANLLDPKSLIRKG